VTQIRRSSIVLLMLAVAAPSLAGMPKAVTGFYDSKEKTTSTEAYGRAKERLRDVEVGMTELEFLERMEMQVLRRKGEPVDAWIDGYLPEVSEQVNRVATCGKKTLVFGFVDRRGSHARVRVILRDRRVVDVLAIPSAVALLER